jgi:hypothetical protein
MLTIPNSFTVAALALTLLTSAACSQAEIQPLGEAHWPAVRDAALKQLKLADGWGQPVLAPGLLNSAGWEDSADLSPDGKRIHVAYIAADFHSWVVRDNGNPKYFARWKRGPDRGAVPIFSIDTVTSRLLDGKWTAPVTHAASKNTKPVWTAETGLTEGGGSVWFCSNAPAKDDDLDPDIWRDGKRLPFNTDADELDPCYRDGELFFWSPNRPGAIGNKSIWVVRKKGEGWGEPEPLPEPINLPGKDAWHPFLDTQGGLWFTSDRDGPLTVFRSQRGDDGSYATPERIVWPSRTDEGLLGVGEPTLSDDGSMLCVCVLFRDEHGNHDLDVVLIPREE